MRIPRIYTPQNLLSGLSIELDSKASNHLLRVLRLRPGALVRVFDGQGREFFAELQACGAQSAILALTKPVVVDMESPLRIHLGQGISRGEKMDYTLQKAVELGVASITPLFTEFTEVKLDPERLQKRMAHWQAIIISACEQSGRNYLPKLQEPRKLAIWLAQCSETLKLLMHPQDGSRLASLDCPDQQLALLAGAEGGFADAEVALAKQFGFTAWQFGPRILRTETAALAAIAALQSRWGDMA